MGRKYRMNLLVFLVFLHLTAEIGLFSFAFGCQKAEQEALSNLKHSFSDPANRLSSWKGQDCCQWEGVECDNVTGNVVTLDLRNRLSRFFSEYDNSVNFSNALSTKKLNPSLLELRHLRYLDLSGNDFQESPIPHFIGLMKHLRYLNLSKAGFGGVVPAQLGNLTRLQTLDLGGEEGGLEWSIDSQGRMRRSLIIMGRSMTVTDLHWVAGLSSLQYLDMSGINLTEANSSIQALSRLPSLSELQLRSCELGNTHLSHAFSNLSSSLFSTLHRLDLSFNNLEGPLPHFFTNLSCLRILNLESNVLNGSIPLSLSNMGALESLILKSNSFSQVEGGTIMGILAKKPCNLRVLDLSQNWVLGGEILGPYDNVSQLHCQLESLYLGNNNNTGALPYWLGELKNLKMLDLESNNFFGSIPTSLGNLSLLEELHFYNNGLSGSIPSSLGGLSSLTILDLSSNFLQGIISDSHLVNLSSLEKLYLYENSLKWELSSIWMPPFQLRNLELGSCVIEGQLPQWIQTQKRLSWLDLSDTGISGDMPEWFWDINLLGFNLSRNNITGSIKHFPSQLSFIDLSHNLLSGPLPPVVSSDSSVRASLCQLRSLEFLDLSNNELSGAIPDCWSNSTRLSIINLSFNRLSGEIPMSIGLITELEYLKLSNNLLDGQLPAALSNCTGLKLLDIGDNKFSGKLPSWGESQSELQILILRANKFGGIIPEEMCSLPQLQILDLAQNNLIGNIPKCLGHLSGMESLQSFVTSLDQSSSPYADKEANAIQVLKGRELEYTVTLKLVKNLDLSSNELTGTIPEELTNLIGLQGMNLSHNHLIGNIPKKIGQMRSLESLDLSNNKISGAIPSSISSLTSLSYLNLSYNKLHGEIPTGNQLQTLNDPFIYSHNIGLCGEPLPNKCTADHDPQQKPDNEEGEGENNLEKVLFYIVIMLGFATGFWGVAGTVLLKKSLRYPLFQLVDDIIEYFYVQIVLRIRQLRN